MIRAVVVLMILLLVVAPAVAADAPSPTDVKRAEYRFREAISAWAYRQWWTLWEMGNTISKFQIPRDEFAARMERSFKRLTAGKAIDKIWVQLSSANYGTIHARLGTRDTITGGEQVEYRAFTVIQEDGDWRISLHEFLGLAK